MGCLGHVLCVFFAAGLPDYSCHKGSGKCIEIFHIFLKNPPLLAVDQTQSFSRPKPNTKKVGKVVLRTLERPIYRMCFAKQTCFASVFQNILPWWVRAADTVKFLTTKDRVLTPHALQDERFSAVVRIVSVFALNATKELWA